MPQIIGGIIVLVVAYYVIIYVVIPLAIVSLAIMAVIGVVTAVIGLIYGGYISIKHFGKAVIDNIKIPHRGIWAVSFPTASIMAILAMYWLDPSISFDEFKRKFDKTRATAENNPIPILPEFEDVVRTNGDDKDSGGIISQKSANKSPKNFIELLKTGSSTEIKAALNAKSLNELTQGNNKPLCIAAQYNQDPEVIGVLIDAGAELNGLDTMKMMTPLHSAAAYNQNAKVVAALIKAGADVNTKIGGSWTPLHYAADKNQKQEIVSALIKAGADVRAKSFDGKTPLHLAARHNEHPEVIISLVNAGSDVNAKDNISLTPLHIAAEHNQQPKIVAALIKAGANVKAKLGNGWTPLHCAVSANETPESQTIIAMLIDAGADVNAKDNDGTTPLKIATENNKKIIAKALFAAGASDNSDITPVTKKYTGNFPALVATGSLSDIADAIKAGADVNTKADNGGMAIHAAAQFNKDPQVIAALIKAGANVNAKFSNGVTPLHCATGNNQNPAVVSALIKAGAGLNARDDDGWTPLHFAAIYSKTPELITTLINAGANVNNKGNTGLTPIHLAALSNKNPAIIDALIKAGADVSTKAADGRTPQQLAIAAGNQLAAQALRDAETRGFAIATVPTTVPTSMSYEHKLATRIGGIYEKQNYKYRFTTNQSATLNLTMTQSGYVQSCMLKNSTLPIDIWDEFCNNLVVNFGAPLPDAALNPDTTDFAVTLNVRGNPPETKISVIRLSSQRIESPATPVIYSDPYPAAQERYVQPSEPYYQEQRGNSQKRDDNSERNRKIKKGIGIGLGIANEILKHSR